VRMLLTHTDNII